jgi:ABC-2 type transport system permease protein
LGNLLANEHRRWWRSRRWLVHLAVWVGIVNGFLAFLSWAIGQDPSMNAETIASTKVEVFGELFPSLLHSTALGAIVAALGAIVGERQRGTAAWILSKPVARGAFVLAKLFAYAAALILLAVLAPATIFYGERILFLGAPPALGPHLAIVGLAVLHLLWYLNLTLLLGTIVQGHGAVAGVALGVLFGGQMTTEVVPSLALVMPHGLMGIARALSLGQPLPTTWPLTIGAVGATVVALIALTLWHFGREEF